MTCSTLSPSIAVAVPRKYIRKPGWRRAANEAGATGGAPGGSAVVAKQTPAERKRSSATALGRVPRAQNARAEPGIPDEWRKQAALPCEALTCCAGRIRAWPSQWIGDSDRALVDQRFLATWGAGGSQ